jgi:hypothetical protein
VKKVEKVVGADADKMELINLDFLMNPGSQTIQLPRTPNTLILSRIGTKRSGLSD